MSGTSASVYLSVNRAALDVPSSLGGWDSAPGVSAHKVSAPAHVLSTACLEMSAHPGPGTCLLDPRCPQRARRCANAVSGGRNGRAVFLEGDAARRGGGDCSEQHKQRTPATELMRAGLRGQSSRAAVCCPLAAVCALGAGQPSWSPGPSSVMRSENSDLVGVW